MSVLNMNVVIMAVAAPHVRVKEIIAHTIIPIEHRIRGTGGFSDRTWLIYFFFGYNDPGLVLYLYFLYGNVFFDILIQLIEEMLKFLLFIFNVFVIVFL